MQESVWGRAIVAVARRMGRTRPHWVQPILNLGPENDTARLLSAKQLADAGEPELAAKLLSQVAGPEADVEINYRCAFYYERAKMYADAERLYSLAILQAPEHAQALYRRGRCRQAMGDIDRAYADAEVSIQHNNSDGRAFALLVETGKRTPPWKMLEILKAGRSTHETDLKWRRNLAKHAFTMKDWPLAADEYEWCVGLSNSSEDALYAGLSSSRAGRFADAERFYREAVQLDERPMVKALGEGYLLQEKSYWFEAGEAYAKRLKDTSSAALENACGFALGRQYRWAEAVPHLRRACQMEGAKQKYFYDLGLALERSGRAEDAAIAYERSINPEAPNGYRLYRLIAALKSAGFIAEAAKWVPDMSRNFVSVEATSWSLRGLEEELQRAEEACNWQGCAAVGRAAVEAGHLELARDAYTAAVKRTPTHDPKLFSALASVYLALGSEGAAVEAFLQSRVFGRPMGVDVRAYLKNKADELSTRYLEYTETLPVDEDLVLYESNHGAAITCSVLPVLQEMVRRDLEGRLTHVVVLNDGRRLPEEISGRRNIIVVSRESELYLRYLATAKWLINNNTFPPYFSRRDQQRYLNLWHGTPIKTLGKDIRSGMMDHRNASRNFLHVTHLAMPNVFTANVLLDRYDVGRLFPGRVAITGSPRMDRSLKLDQDRRLQIRALLGATETDRLVLYAPTWRGDLADKRVDTGFLEAALKAMSTPNTVVAFRGHPMMEAGLTGLKTDATTVPGTIDTNELIAAVDVVVSDYSSIAVDAVGVGTRTVLYVPDLEEYRRDRGLYIDLNALPVEVAASLDALKTAMRVMRQSEASPKSHPLGWWAEEDGGAVDRVIGFFFDDDESCWWNSDSFQRKACEIVCFEGHFIPNGVTASAVQYNKMLANHDIGTTLSVEPNQVVPYRERREIFSSLPDSVGVLPRVGVALRTPEDAWLNAMFMHHDQLWSPEQMRMLKSAYAREYRRLYGAASFDAAVCFEGYSRYWALVLASAPAAVRKVVYMHNEMVKERENRFPYLDGIFQFYPEFDSLCSVSESVAGRNAASFGARIAGDDRFIVAENMIDPAEIRRRSLESPDPRTLRFIEGRKGHIFVNVARLSPEKGLDTLLSAFSRVSGPDDGLVLIGTGALEGSLRALAASLGVSSQVHFSGYQRNPFSIMGKCDSFVLSSHYEGQGIAVLEAMVLGLPVVSTDIPGPRSILAQGDGLLVESTEDGLVRGMNALQRNAVPKPRFDFDAYESRAIHGHISAIRASCSA